MFIKKLNKIFLENNFICNFIIIKSERTIFFSIKDVLKCCGYDIFSKNIINQTLSHIKKKNIININYILENFNNIEYSKEDSKEDINLENNNIYISDVDLFYFLISLKKGIEFKKCIFGEIFSEIKNFYISNN